jgi:hypothetical protein
MTTIQLLIGFGIISLIAWAIVELRMAAWQIKQHSEMVLRRGKDD